MKSTPGGGEIVPETVCLQSVKAWLPTVGWGGDGVPLKNEPASLCCVARLTRVG